MEHSFDFYTRWCMCGVGEAEQMTNPSQCSGIAGPPRRFPLAESPRQRQPPRQILHQIPTRSTQLDPFGTSCAVT